MDTFHLGFTQLKIVTMKTKLIKLSDDHYIVVDDSDIKERDSCYDYYTKSIQQSTPNVNDGNAEEYFKKITHSNKPLELTRTIAVDKLVFYKIRSLSLTEVEEAINGYSVQNSLKKLLREDENFYSMIDHTSYKEGFKAHQELVKDKLFTIEDMKNLFAKTLEHAPSTESHTRMISDEQYRHFVMGELFNKLIKSLIQTEWDIEINEQGKIKLI